MKLKLLDCVILKRDVAEHGLCRGDLGTVVEVYRPDVLAIEFVTATGETKAVLTLKAVDVRKVQPSDVLAVRSPG